MPESSESKIDPLIEKAERGLTGFVGKIGSQRDEYTNLPPELAQAMIEAGETGDKTMLLNQIGGFVSGDSQIGAIASNVLTGLLQQAGINLSAEQIAAVASGDDEGAIRELTERLSGLYESVATSRVNMDHISDRTLQTTNAGRKVTKPIRNNPEERIGRNDPCPCGSGRKYKKCHLGQELPAKDASEVPKDESPSDEA